MAEEAKPKAEAEVKKPSAKPASNINNDGLIKGQIVSEADYWAVINKNKAKK